MPNFTIRRRRKPQAEPKQTPPPMEEEKVDESEMDASSDEDEYLDKAIADLRKTTISDKDETMPQSPARSEAHYSEPARNEYRPTRNDQYRPHYAQPRRMNDPYRRNPTMDYQKPTSKHRRGGAKIRFKSHYGVDGEYLDTQTKAALLYTHCFG